MTAGKQPFSGPPSGRRLAFTFNWGWNSPITAWLPGFFNMPVNSPDAQRFATSLHYEGDLSLYTGFSHPKGSDRPKVRRFLDTEFKRQPAIARILSNEPPFFTSNHAPFFVSPQG
jgi:hypothetical protein